MRRLSVNVNREPPYGLHSHMCSVLLNTPSMKAEYAAGYLLANLLTDKKKGDRP